MKEEFFPFTCDCKIEVSKFGNFNLTLKHMPHPTDDSGANTVITTGRTLGEAFFNMGHRLMLLFESQAPGFLDSVVAEILYPEHSS